MNPCNGGKKKLCIGFLIWGVAYVICGMTFGEGPPVRSIWWLTVRYYLSLFAIVFLTAYGLGFVVEGVRMIWKADSK